MSSYYSDPTGNIACGVVDREFKSLEKEAKLERRLKKQIARRLKRYEEARNEKAS